MYRNQEGYADPTAGNAIENVLKEQEKNKFMGKNQEILSRPKIYIISNHSGSKTENISMAIKCCQYAIAKGKIPVAPHLLYPRILNDGDPEERKLGIIFGVSLMDFCNEVWFFGNNLSSSAKTQLQEAKLRGKPIRYFEWR
ncbi:hypothetical protein B5F08_11330 [Anaeromassilibacillus sp. An172]|uniref:DUF7768 domain-containing protein n=1 Tax=Anaeromassilibacillus sp. An172 TaxID=1965570 RepID=UPI000B369ED0|nr:DUF4406 domain-containing protein [Anaeromassilibacillus sp. An172]OUP75300.1 hypothetical protein B5F08_11330 [Anaeromassilibacillus sp. An172]